MRLRYSVRQRRRARTSLGSSLDSQKGGDKTHGDRRQCLGTLGGKVRVCGSTKSRAPLGSRWRLEDMDPSFRARVPGLRELS